MIEGMMDESMMSNMGGGSGGRGPGNQGGPNRGQRGGGGGGRGGGQGGGNQRGPGGQSGGGMQNRSQDDRLMERISSINGPTHELPPIDLTEKKFNGRNRLYVGNLTSDVSEEEIQQMFGQYGETHEIFINKEKNFAFLRLVRNFYFFPSLFFLSIFIKMIINYGCFLE